MSEPACESRTFSWTRLFWEMFRIAAFVIGGGYVILSVADRRFSEKLKWTRPGELFEMLPLFQMVPGIIGGHTAVYVGYRLAGVRGALVALSGMTLPSVILFTVVSMCYRSMPIDGPLTAALFLGLRAALTGLLMEMVGRMWRKSVADTFGYAVLATALVLMQGFGAPPGWVIVGGMAAGIAAVSVSDRWGGKGSDSSSPRVFRSFWALPLIFVGYGLIAFGGGFVLVPVFLRDFVGEAAAYLQLAPHDFANVMALTQMTPGPVAVNCATFFGYNIAGVGGAALATFSLLVPGFVILLVALRSLERFRSSVIVRGVFRGVRPVTLALLLCATWAIASSCLWRTAETGLAFSPLAIALTALSCAAVATRRLGGVATIVLSSLVSLVCGVLLPSAR